jgi:hypothetical protein
VAVRWFGGLALASLAAFLLAACSSAPGRISTATSTTTTEAPTTPPTLPSTTTTSEPAVPIDTPQCSAGDFRPSWTGQGDGASGTLFYVVNLLNASAVTCVTGGYVGVSAYDPAGDLIAASESHDLLGSDEPPTLLVAPGTTVHFIVGLPDVNEAAGGIECSTTVGAFHLIPPNETTEVQIATPVSTGYPSLCGSTFFVGPLQSNALNY